MTTTTETTPESKDYAAAMRAKCRDRGEVYLGPGVPAEPFDRVLDHVAGLRQAAAELEREAVLVGRRSGASWARLAFLLRGSVTPDGLRHRYRDDRAVKRGGGYGRS